MVVAVVALVAGMPVAMAWVVGGGAGGCLNTKRGSKPTSSEILK